MTFATLWANFWTWMDVHPAARFLFRGQASRDPIIPKIGRSEYSYDAARETQLFKAFKRAARPLVTPAPLNDWEWLALAQHHGAPTRLVDWSTSPLVAAWFAVTSYPIDTEAVIFALDINRTDLERIDVSDGTASGGGTVMNPLALTRGVHLVETPPITARITTQRGLFTVHGIPTNPLDIPVAEQFVVPVDLRSDFQGQLLDLGIDASHIFPDLDGLCRTIDWRLRSGRGFSAFH